MEPIIERNRCNKQYSVKLTRWIDRLTHFDISIQHITGSNLKFADYLSRNPVGGATPKKNYDEEYVFIILAEQTDLKLKHGSLFADQSNHTENKTKLHNNKTEKQNEQERNQSQRNRTFENAQNVNKTEQSETTTSGQSDISTRNSSRKSTTEKMDQENFYHWEQPLKPWKLLDATVRRREN